MKFIKQNLYRRKSNLESSLSQNRVLNQFIFLFMILGFNACSDFVEVDPPKNFLVSETVFNDSGNVESALANIFYDMRELGMTSGGANGLTTLLGVYSDELDSYLTNLDDSQFYLHTVTSENTKILGWWTNAYNIIYSANDIIKGVENSNTLDSEDKDHFKGQALFIRAYIHSLLVNIYGDIPYITTTDYIENNSVSRLSTIEVNEMIIQDLITAVDLLENTGDPSDENVIPGLSTARALLARMYLYNENWELAETIATQLINSFDLEPNLNDVFLKESSGTIWQYKSGDGIKNTLEAPQFIITNLDQNLKFSLSEALLLAFEDGDLRLTSWIGNFSDVNNTTTLYFAYKYKANLSETASLEYSIAFRLAEQYLIRAEARAKQGDILGAQQDLNVIRNRAGLSNTTASTESDLLNAILQERRVELFTEQGHRWLDLKRTNNASNVLSPIKPNWQETDILFPIPENELVLNPNLLPQNSGY